MKNLEDINNEEAVNQVRFIQFDLGSENYGIKLLSVKEVIPMPDTTPMPNAPSHFIGIMNLRGQIISIIDLRKRLGVKPKTEGLEEAVIIVEYDGVGIGVVVDSINKVLNININDIAEVPEIGSKVNGKYIQGVYRVDDKLTIMLDLRKVLNIEDIKKSQQEAA